MIGDLIYDVGMNDGNDTAYYLYKGFRVVAIEADPILAARGRERFADEIRQGRLTILDVGIGPQAEIARFWVNDERSEWSSFVRELACREGTACHSIDVRCVRFGEILGQYGVPFYLKIDIEHNDAYCLEDITVADTPQYISVEANDLQDLIRLSNLGYNAFKCVNQKNHNDPLCQSPKYYSLLTRGRRAWQRANARRRGVPQTVAVSDRHSPRAGATPAPLGQWHFPWGSSGPFGEDTYGQWKSLEEITYDFLHLKLGYQRRCELNPRGWHDFHATKRR